MPDVGDYRVRYIADTPILLVRGENGEIHAHVNMCRHRGAPVCRAEKGRALSFRCPYHGWTYRADGTLAGLPFQERLYADPIRLRSQLNLLPVRVQNYRGLIFGTLDENAPPLEEFLGESTCAEEAVLINGIPFTHGGYVARVTQATGRFAGMTGTVTDNFWLDVSGGPLDRAIGYQFMVIRLAQRE